MGCVIGPRAGPTVLLVDSEDVFGGHAGVGRAEIILVEITDDSEAPVTPSAKKTGIICGSSG